MQAVDGEGLDGLVVTHLPNIRYLTGFSGSAGLVVALPNETILLSDFRYREQAQQEVGDSVRIEIVKDDIWSRLWELLEGYPGLEQLGFESHVVTVAQAQRFQKDGVPVKMQPIASLVERQRASKDSHEVEAVRSAAALAMSALDVTLESVRVGQREQDVAATLERELRVRGSEWHPFQTIVASGPRSALPHASTSTREIEPGDWLLLDFGAQVDGYCADITRTVVVGRPADERQRTMYELVRDAQMQARQQVRAGMTGREADALARSLIEDQGFGEAFGHSLGHGLGLEVHEEPRLSARNEKELPCHAVVTIEPGVYFPGWGGVRIEDDVYLGPEGAELLSDGKTELLELN